MGQKKKHQSSQSPEETKSEQKNVHGVEKGNMDKHDEESAEKPRQKTDEKSEQVAFINEVEETENLIDPGNEHHHQAGDADS